jgi:hypothetical protein
MNTELAEHLRQIVIFLFQSLRLQQEHLQRMTASLQAVQDAIEAHDPELCQKFQTMYPAVEKKTAEVNAPLIRLIDEQLAACSEWVLG